MWHAALLMHRRFESLTAGITDRRIPEELDQRCVRYRRGAKDDGIRGKKAQLREPRCGHDDARDSNRKANKKRKKVPRASRDRFLAVARTIRGVPMRKEEKEIQAFRTSRPQRRVARSSRREKDLLTIAINAEKKLET